MKKLKAIGFGTLYLVIAIMVQFVMMFRLIIQLTIERVPYNQIMDYFAGLEKNYRDNLILTTVGNLIYIAGFGLWYYFIRTRRDRSPVNYRTICSPRVLLLMMGMAVCAQFCCNLIMMAVYAVFPAEFEKYLKLMETLDISVMPAWAMLLIVAVWAPLAEELIFRAMIFRTLRKGFGFWVAALISGAAFGLYHMNLVQGIYAGVFGVLLAYVYEKTNSLLGCYLFHFLFNLSSYGIEAVEKRIPLPEGIQGAVVLVLSILSIFGMIALLRCFSRIYQTSHETLESDGLEVKNEDI